MNLNKPKVSVVTVNYNHGKYLEAYIQSLNASEYPIAEIIIVDNNSTDDSLDILNRYAAQVKVVRNEYNIGYSQALNQAFRLASSQLVCATGPDVVVEPGWLKPLVDQYLCDPDSTFVVASQVYLFDKKTIQSAGGSLHFTGHLTVYDMWKPGDKDCSDLRQAEVVGAIDSSSALFDQGKFLKIGGCDLSYFVYHEEFDYCYRARMRGWKCWYQPQSVVYHGSGTVNFSSRHNGEYPAARPYLHTRNRWNSIIKNYQLRTIIIILPVMLLVETLNLALLACNGLHKSYIKAWADLWRNRKELFRKRAIIQPTRCLPDSRLLEAGPLTISPVLMDSPFLNRLKILLDGFLSIYWHAMKFAFYP